MGKIKSKPVKRAAKKLIEKKFKFSKSFEENKQALKEIAPNKKSRNQLAGFLCRLKKQEKTEMLIK